MRTGWTIPLRAALALGVLLVLGQPPPASSHESLYNYVEVTVSENGELEVAFSVHAAELLSSPAVDPTTSDTSWYPMLTPTEKAELSENATAFLRSGYSLSSSDQESISTPEISVAENLDDGARPGCLLGLLHFAEPPQSLTIHYRESAKRLMLVIVRPRAFPEVRDLATGESLTLTFPPE